MAQFNADIELIVNSTGALRRIKEVENRINQLSQAAASINIGSRATQEAKELTQIVERLRLSLEQASQVKFDIFQGKGRGAKFDGLNVVKKDIDDIVRRISAANAAFKNEGFLQGSVSTKSANVEALRQFQTALNGIRKEVLGLPGLPAALDGRSLALQAEKLREALQDVRQELKPGSTEFRNYTESIEFLGRNLDFLTDKALEASRSLDHFRKQKSR